MKTSRAHSQEPPASDPTSHAVELRQSETASRSVWLGRKPRDSPPPPTTRERPTTPAATTRSAPAHRLAINAAESSSRSSWCLPTGSISSASTARFLKAILRSRVCRTSRPPTRQIVATGSTPRRQFGRERISQQPPKTRGERSRAASDPSFTGRVERSIKSLTGGFLQQADANLVGDLSRS